MNSQRHRVIENEWIVLKDGTRLAARIWLPASATADPGPAVLEFLPYRKRNGTAQRDESTYPVFAAAGIAGVRVDIRGSGESDGVIDGEYTPRELSDACEVIDWISRQPWSNGNVGMMGISWGGFNCLQVAALKPPALKAVISIASTVDRYNDDIHYKNGTHLSAQLSWAATMQAYQSRPPDPEIVGERWRDMWLERLEQEPFFMEEWLSHQRRDDFWRHGSISEDFDGFDVPALVIAGWADGYRSTPLKALQGMPSRASVIVGPWIHKYPHFAYPKPRADFHGEAIAWWNRWLRGEVNEASELPRMRAFILDGPRPSPWREHDPGFWVAKREWTPPEMLDFGIGPDATLVAGSGDRDDRNVVLHSPLDTGTGSGDWFTMRPGAELPADQRLDDAGSLVFDSAVLTSDISLLGQPVLKIRLSSDAALANLCARLVDVHPDGTGTRVSFGVMNLAHRLGNSDPRPLVPGEAFDLVLVLDACGYNFGPGHRIRLSLSSAYWPTVLPPPQDASLALDLASVVLSLPLLGDHERIDLPQPTDPDPLPVYDTLEPGRTERGIERDLTGRVTHYRIVEDTGLTRHPANGMAWRDAREEVWSIGIDDPLSSAGECRWTCVTEREGWNTTTVTTSTLSCTDRDWIISASVEAFENQALVFSRRKRRTIARDMM